MFHSNEQDTSGFHLGRTIACFSNFINHDCFSFILVNLDTKHLFSSPLGDSVLPLDVFLPYKQSIYRFLDLILILEM